MSDEFTTNRLGRRLQSLELRTPARTADAIMQHQRPSRRAASRLRVGVAALGAGIAILLGTGYFAPASGQVLADAPGAGPVASRMLASLGLGDIGPSVRSLDSSALASGREVDLVGGYSDGGVTVLVVRLVGGHGVLLPASLHDQFGRSSALYGATTDLTTGYEILTFHGLSWPDAWLGARLQLTIGSLSAPEGGPVAGPWVLNGTIVPSRSRDIPVSSARLSDGRIAMIEYMRRSDSIVAVKVHIAPGGNEPTFDSPTHPPAEVTLSNSASGDRRPIGQSIQGSRGGVIIEAYWSRVNSGNYSLVIRSGGSMTSIGVRL